MQPTSSPRPTRINYMMAGVLWQCLCADSQFSCCWSPFQIAPLKLSNTGKPSVVDITMPSCHFCHTPAIIGSARLIILDMHLFLYQVVYIFVKVHLAVSTSNNPLLLSLCFHSPPTAAVLFSSSVHFIALLDPCHLCPGTVCRPMCVGPRMCGVYMNVHTWTVSSCVYGCAQIVFACVRVSV